MKINRQLYRNERGCSKSVTFTFTRTGFRKNSVYPFSLLVTLFMPFKEKSS